MPTPQRLPIVNSDDGVWGDIIRQYIAKEHYNDDTDNAANGGHQKITIRAGTAAAGTAPLKFTSGTLLTTPEAGAVEFNSDNLYFTQTTGTTRKKVATYDDASGATGDIYYRNSSGYFTRLGAGGAGDILTIASGIPSWTATIVGKVLDNTNTVTLKDTNFTLQDDTDTTKQAKFQLSGITTGTTRTYTLPDASGTFLLSTNATFADNAFTLRDDGDATKQLRFQLSGITSATTRTLTAPDANTTIVGTDTTQTLTNKTLSSPRIDTIKDSSGTNSVVLGSNASAVNYLQIDNASTGLNPTIYASGSDANVGLNIVVKGTKGLSIYDASWSNIFVAESGTPGSNVNYPFVKPATTGNSATFGVWGSDTNINLELSTKGSGVVTANGVQVATVNDVHVSPVSSGSLLYNTTIDLHPESQGFNKLPHIVNDIAYNTIRGGSVTYKLNGSPVSPTGPDAPFLPDATIANSFGMTNIATDVIVAEVTTHVTFEYGNTVGIVMTPWCAAKNVVIEIYDPIATTWLTIHSATNDTSGIHWANSYASGSYDGAHGFSKIRFTLSNFISSGNFRISQIYVANYASELASGPFFTRGGGSLYGTNAAPPAITSTGTDANIGLTLHPKGSSGVSIYADTGQTATLHAGGVDTNVDLNFNTKGTGVVKAKGNPIITSTTAIPAVSGTPSSSTYLRGDGTWATPAGGGGGASGMVLPVQAHTDGSETYTIVSGSVTQISGTTVQQYGSYAPAIGDRILIMTAPATSGAGTQFYLTTNPANGIYVVTGNTTNLSLSRAADFSGSVNPAGLSVFTTNASLGWQPQAQFTVILPTGASAFTYGTDNLQFGSTAGRSLFPNSLYIGNGQLGMWNNTPSISTYLMPNSATPGGSNQNLTLPAITTDTIVSRTSTDTLTNKTLTTPTIGDFTNAGHNHQNAAGGGQLQASTALNATGTPSSTTFLRGDNTWATPAGGGSSGETVSTSAATSLTLTTTNTMYVFTGGSATTWTLPAVSGNTGTRFIISNRGSASITLQRAGSDNIYVDVVAVNIVIGPGASRVVVNDGTYWVVTSTVALTDADLILQDENDTSKQAVFNVSGISTSTRRTYTLPNASASIPGKYTATIGDGSTTAIAVTHNLNTKDIVWSIRDATTDEFVDCDVTSTSTTQTTFTFATAPATNSLKVVIIG